MKKLRSSTRATSAVLLFLSSGACHSGTNAGGTTAVEHVAEVAPQPPPTLSPLPEGQSRFAVPIAGSPSRGAPHPTINIVEFTDFQCPFCSRVQPTLAALEERYPNDVRIYFRNTPLAFHQNAMPAAEAAMEARAQGGDDAFFKMHDLVFANQNALEAEDLQQYAHDIGLDMPRFVAAMNDHRHQPAIEADAAIGAQFGVSGTPHFFINGRPIRGAQSVDKFDALIRDELTRVAELTSHGVTPDGVLPLLYATALDHAPPREERQRAERPAGRAHVELAIPSDAPRFGSASAPITIQIISDFQCPFCSRAEPTLDAIVAHYGEQVSLVWRNYPLPFHENAQPAAQAAVEAYRQGGNTAFWAFKKALFQNNRDLTRATILRLAGEAQLNVAQLEAALDHETHAERVHEDIAAVNAAMDSIGTPTFLINGEVITGAQPFDQFAEKIDALLGAAAPARAAATTPAPRARGHRGQHH